MEERETATRPAVEQAFAAIDLLDAPAGVLDREGRVAYLNAAWRALGAVADAGIGPLHWSGLLHPDFRDAATALLSEAGSGAGKVDFECRLATTGDMHDAFLASFHPIVDGPDRRAGWLCIATVAHAPKQREAGAARRESILTGMLDISIDCIKVISPEGELVHINKAGREALGVPTEPPPPGLRWLSLLPEAVREAGQSALATAVAGRASRFPGHSVQPGGPEQFWDNLLTPILDAEGNTTSILCVSRDVTAERHALRQLRESEERLEIAARVGGLGIWDYDIRADRLYCDESWYRIMGRDPRRPVVGIADLRPLIHPDDVEMATEVQRTAAELVASQRDYSIAFRIIRPDGEVRWLRSLAYVRERDGVPLRAIGFVTDITEALHGERLLRDANRALEEERSSLERGALEDPVTGIANRRRLDGELARACGRALETGEPLCIGMVDIDRFKQFNDRYGHLEGDAALRKVAQALQAAARQSDFVARYGGEEFTFVLPGTDDPQPFLERFIAAVAALAIPHADSPNGLLTTSCGVIVASPPDLSPEQLLQLGDQALYEAKLAGRNCYVVRDAEA